MKNHLGEREYQTYAGWKRACKKAAGKDFIFYDGNKDICSAFSSPFVPCVLSQCKPLGQWEGDKGSIFN